jgi:hypothetical protein
VPYLCFEIVFDQRLIQREKKERREKGGKGGKGGKVRIFEKKRKKRRLEKKKVRGLVVEYKVDTYGFYFNCTMSRRMAGSFAPAFAGFLIIHPVSPLVILGDIIAPERNEDVTSISMSVPANDIEGTSRLLRCCRTSSGVPSTRSDPCIRICVRDDRDDRADESGVPCNVACDFGDPCGDRPLRGDEASITRWVALTSSFVTDTTRSVKGTFSVHDTN